MFEFLCRKRNPTQDWRSYDGRPLRFNLNDGSLNNVKIGQPLDYLSFLGPSEALASYSDCEFRYYSLGVCVECNRNDYTISGYHVVYRDRADENHTPFGGDVVFDGRVIDPGRMSLEDAETLFGKTSKVDEYDDEIVIYYFFGPLKWEIEFGNDSQLNLLILSRKVKTGQNDLLE